MTDDPIRHRALADNLAARLRCCSILWLQVIDRAMGADEGVRGGDRLGRRWERRIATGPGDIDRSWHLVRLAIPSANTACRGVWSAADHIERHDNPPLPERCGACWRAAVEGDALAIALIDTLDEIVAEERAKEGLHEQARAEMVGAGAVLTATSGPGGPYLLEPIDPPIVATGTRRALPADALIVTEAEIRARAARERRTAIRMVADDGEAPDESGGGG